MGCAQSPSWYDAAFETVAYRQSAHEAPWKHLWQAAAQFVAEAKATHVLDVGCGPAHVVELLQCEAYTGVDFAPRALQVAQERCLKTPIAGKFIQADLDNQKDREQVSRLITPNTAVLFLECLEHFASDLAMLQSVPPNILVFATVPAFDDAGHVRHFPCIEDVIQRYHHLFSACVIEPVGPHNRHFCIRGRR